MQGLEQAFRFKIDSTKLDPSGLTLVLNQPINIPDVKTIIIQNNSGATLYIGSTPESATPGTAPLVIPAGKFGVFPAAFRHTAQLCVTASTLGINITGTYEGIMVISDQVLPTGIWDIPIVDVASNPTPTPQPAQQAAAQQIALAAGVSSPLVGAGSTPLIGRSVVLIENLNASGGVSIAVGLTSSVTLANAPIVLAPGQMVSLPVTDSISLYGYAATASSVGVTELT